MNKTINAIRRSLNLSQKELEAYQKRGLIPVTFVGENLQPFHAFASSQDLDSHASVIRFQHLGEFIHASHVGERVEGWFKKTKVLVFEVMDFAVPQEEREPRLLTA